MPRDGRCPRVRRSSSRALVAREARNTAFARPGLGDALALALATACGVQAVQAVFFVAVAPVPPAFFLSHFVVVAAVQLLLAAALFGRANQRAWAAAVFLLPVAHAAGALGESLLGGVSIPLALGLAAVATGAWAKRGPGAGAPWIAGVLGAALAAEIARFHRSAYRGAETEATALLLLAGVSAAAGLAFAASAALPLAVRVPGRGASAALGLVGALAALPALWPRPPAPGPPAGGAPIADSAPIVLVVLDTVSAFHLSLYGYARETMPRLARFARDEALVAPRAVANSSWTLPSHGSRG